MTRHAVPPRWVSRRGDCRHSLDALPEAIVVCDDDGAVLYRNRAAQALVEARDADVLVARAVEELLQEARATACPRSERSSCSARRPGC